MRSIITLILCGFCTYLSAQITLTVDALQPTPGDKFIGFFYSVDPSVYPAGDAGANVTWDFSGLRDSLPNDLSAFFDGLRENPFLTFEVIDPASGIFSDNFPDADFAIFSEINFFGRLQSYSYMNTESDGFYEAGDVSISEFEFLGQSFVDTTITQNDPATLFLQLPLTYLDTYISTSMDVDDTTTPGFIIETTTKDSVVVDGYGTLLAPYGRVENVLRLAYYSEETTVEKVEATGTVLETSTETSVFYQWMSDQTLAPVLQYDLPSEDDDEDLATLFFFVPEDFTSQTSLRKLPEIPAQVAPNPVKDITYITFGLEKPQEEVEIALFDLHGRLVQSQIIRNLNSGKHQFSVIVPDQLSSGMYTLTLKTKEGFARKKIVKH